MTGDAPVAITGGTGFVGQSVIDEAAAAGVGLRALTRRAQDTRAGVEWVAGDLGDEAALARLMDGTRAVIHIAGLTNTPDPAQFHAANVTGTANVIAAARAAKVKRFVFVSSLAAREPGLSAYGASKAEAETLVRESGLDWTIIRPPGVYGPRDVDYLDMFRSARFGFVPLPPGGASSIIHVADLARLLLAMVDAQPALVLKKMFEPDDGREGGWSHKELAAAIGRAVGRRVFAPHLPRVALDMAARVDGLMRGAGAKLTPDRVGYMAHPNWVARSDRGIPPNLWQPHMTGDDGLVQTARWYREQGWL